MKRIAELIFRQYLPKWLVLLFVIAAARRFPEMTEIFFSRGFYALARNIDLFFLRLIPFSVGDLLYAAVPVWWIWKVVTLTKARRNPLPFIERSVWLAVLWFYLLWGLNYFRLSPARLEGLEVRPPSESALREVTLRLTDSLQILHRRLAADSVAMISVPSDRELRIRAARLMRTQGHLKPWLYQPWYVIKPSLWSEIISYGGISGYFNPYTHEAQYNAHYPAVFRPHIMLHELAHQAGFAHETAAEFLAWQTAAENGDPLFRYSSHLTAMEYLLAYWRRKDPALYKKYLLRLPPGTRKELEAARRFRQLHRLPVDTSRPYDVYLKLHQEGAGLEAYSRLTACLAAYFEKNIK
ncbi:MAG: DUF3810 domain-containing protein [Chlorobi bacterium]|nr:DUF3810 domain-containing protein [Chlorobiota bacterium]